MNQPELPDKRNQVRQKSSEPTKKPYHKPEFRFERVFETRALSCGKAGTEGQCFRSIKNS